MQTVSDRKIPPVNEQKAGREQAEAYRPIRVLFLHDHIGYPGGATHGVTTYFLSVLPNFDPTQVETLLCINRERHSAADKLAAAGIRSVFLNRSKWDPFVLWDLFRLIRKERIDVLHITGIKGMLLGRIAARLTSRPAIVHFHDPKRAWPHFVQRRLARWTTWALAVCEPVRQAALRDYGLPPEKVEVLHNGIASERFDRHGEYGDRRRLRAELRLWENAPVIGVFGRVFPEKGQHVLLRALPNILARSPETKLVIVGDGPERAECERLCSALGILNSVRFTGHRTDIAELLSAVDVVAVPSMWEEPLPYVALEALCAGRPVVAFRVGGIPEIIINEKTGLLVPKGDIDALAHALLRLLEDKSLRERLADGGRQRTKHFTVERHIHRLTEIYHTVCSTYATVQRPSGSIPELPEGRL